MRLLTRISTISNPQTPGLTPSRKRTSLAQPLAVSPQEEGARKTQDHAQQCEQRVAPAVAEAAVQARREQREAEASEGSEHGAGADGGGGVARVRVDQEGLEALEADDGGGGEEEGADVGEDPVRLELGGPAVHDEADGHEDGAGDHHGDAVLGAAGAAVPPLERHVDAVLQRRADLGAHEEAEAEREVVEPADAEGLAVAVGPRARPQRRERRQHDVDQPIYIKHIHGQHLHYNLRSDHTEGPHQRDPQQLGDGAVRVVVRGVQRRVARLLDEAFLFPEKQDRAVRLLEEEHARPLDHGVRDRGGVERPPPCRVLRDEAPAIGPIAGPSSGARL